MFLSVFGLLNGYFHFFDIESYIRTVKFIPFPHLLAGYFGVFFSIFILPIPDYVLLPLFGYLSSVNVFNPFTIYFVTLAGAVLPLEYAAGRFAGRPLLLKVLSYVGIKEGDIEVADKWLHDHGKFSIFMATFVPYFYTGASLAAGTLKMKTAPYMVTSTVGFAIRYAALEYTGFYGIYILAPSFDYSHRILMIVLLVGTVIFIVIYVIRDSK